MLCSHIYVHGTLRIQWYAQYVYMRNNKESAQMSRGKCTCMRNVQNNAQLYACKLMVLLGYTILMRNLILRISYAQCTNEIFFEPG